MNKIFVVGALCGMLGGCQTTLDAVSSVNADIAHLSQYTLPVACGVVRVAEGYFHALQGRFSASTVAAEARAEAAVTSICANPPTNAIEALASAYAAIQAYTVVPTR